MGFGGVWGEGEERRGMPLGNGGSEGEKVGVFSIREKIERQKLS